MSSHRPTIKEIAQRCEVSRGTVDRVLNGRGKVRPEIARLVEEVAKALDYRPNTVAKSLATHGRGAGICVILHVQGNFFYDDVLKGVDRAAAEIKDFGIRVSVRRGANFDVDAQIANIDAAIAEGFESIVLVPINHERIIARVQEATAAGIQFVYINSFIEGTQQLCYIGCDYFKSGRMAAQLFHMLVGPGARIGMVSPPLLMRGHYLRKAGLEDAIRSEYPGMELVALAEVPSDEELSFIRTRSMLVEHPGINSIFYSTGGLTGGLNAMRDLGRYGSLTIIGVDDARPVMEGILDGGIQATICQEPEEQGYTAIKTMFEYLLAQKEPPTRDILIDPSIKIRQSFWREGE